MGIRYQVDMDKPTQATRLSTRLYQGDEEANRITLELVRGGQKAEVGTLTVTGEMERADGVRVPCEGSQNGNTVSIVLNEHCYYVPGPCVIYLMASAGGVLRTMLELHGQVVQKSDGPMVDVNEELVDVDAVIKLYGEMRTAKEETERATAAADEATTAANAATSNANTATTNANNATNRANAAAQALENAPVPTGTVVTYQVGTSGTTPPSGNWLDAVPTVQQGQYLWTRVMQIFSNGDPLASYSVSRFGIDGSGSVSSVNGVLPDASGNVVLDAEKVGARPDTWTPTAQDVGALAADGIAVDASKLGGKSHEEYALTTDVGIKLTLAWQNASPASEFPKQVVSVPGVGNAKYMVMEVASQNNWHRTQLVWFLLPMASPGGVIFICQNATNIFSRLFTVGESTIGFETGLFNTGEGDIYAVPTKIFIGE